MKDKTFLKELEELINKYSKENKSDTPDFILAEYLNRQLEVFNVTIHDRECWYGRHTNGGSIESTQYLIPASDKY